MQDPPPRGDHPGRQNKTELWGNFLKASIQLWPSRGASWSVQLFARGPHLTRGYAAEPSQTPEGSIDTIRNGHMKSQKRGSVCHTGTEGPEHVRVERGCLGTREPRPQGQQEWRPGLTTWGHGRVLVDKRVSWRKSPALSSAPTEQPRTRDRLAPPLRSVPGPPGRVPGTGWQPGEGTVWVTPGSAPPKAGSLPCQAAAGGTRRATPAPAAGTVTRDRRWQGLRQVWVHGRPSLPGWGCRWEGQVRRPTDSWGDGRSRKARKPPHTASGGRPGSGRALPGARRECGLGGGCPHCRSPRPVLPVLSLGAGRAQQPPPWPPLSALRSGHMGNAVPLPPS